MEYDYKIVRFDLYCNKCKYYKLNQDEEPCNECLTNPVSLHSQKPIKFEENDKKRNKGYTFRQISKLTFEKLKKLTFGKLKGD